MGGLLLDVEADADGEFAGEGDEFEVADAQAEEFHGDGTAAGGDVLGLVHVQEGEVGLDAGEFFHRVDVLTVLFEVGAIDCVHFLEVFATEHLFREVTVGVVGGVFLEAVVFVIQFHESAEVEAGSLQRTEESELFGFKLGDAVREIGAGEVDRFVDDFQGVGGGDLNPTEGFQGTESEEVTEGFGIAGVIDFLVTDGINVTAAALNEEGDGVGGEIFLDDFGGEAGEVGGVSSAGDSEDRMAGEVVEDGDGVPLFIVEAEEADFGIDRTDGSHLFIGGEGVGVAAVGFAAVLELDAAVFLNAVFVADSGPDADRDQAGMGLLDSSHGPFGGIGSDQAVTMTGIDRDMQGRNSERSLELIANFSEVIVFDGADLTDGDGINGHDGGGGLPVGDDEGTGIHAIVGGAGIVISDIDFGCSGTETGGVERIGGVKRKRETEKNQQQGGAESTHGGDHQTGGG